MGRLSIRTVLALAVLLPPWGCDCGGDPLDRYVPDVRVRPATLDFGELPLGASLRLTLDVLNDGTAPAVLEGPITIEADENAGYAGLNDPFPLGAGGFVGVDVVFAPRVEGELNGTLQLPFEDPQGLVEVPLLGVGAPADVAIRPGTIDFGTLPAGASVARTVTVENRTTSELQVPLAVDIPGYLIEGSPRVELVLPANGAIDVDITFAPVRGGAYDGLVIAEVCGAGCGPRALLRGAGEAPRISASPRPLDFGEVAAGATGQQTLTLANAGVGNLTISAITPFDAEGRLTASPGTLPLVLAAGESADVPVSFQATQPDAQVSASVLVDSNDLLSPRVSIPVSATTPGAALRVVPEAGHLGILDPGASRTIDIVALSRGTAPVTIEDIRLTGSNSFDWTTALPPVPLELAPGESLLLSVVGTATTADASFGGANAHAVFTTAEAGEAQAALTFVSGTAGCQPRSPLSAMYLGGMRLGQGAQGRLEVVNEGDGACTLESVEPVPGLAFDPGFSFDVFDIESLVPGQGGHVRFAFYAATPGTFSAWVRVKFVEQEAPLLLSVTASGVLGSLVAEPPTLEFGPGIVDCVARLRAMNFVNDGGAEVTVNSVNLVPADARFTIATIPLPAIVPAGGSLTVSVRPVTDAAGVFTGQIVADTEELGEVNGTVTSIVEPPGTPLTEVFTVEDEPTNKVDILFVVDNSGSMADDQEQLAANFASFINVAQQSTEDIDFHIGVTSTDVIEDNGLKGRLRGPPAVLTRATPNLQQTFENYARLGTNGSPIEIGLEAVRLALSEPNRSGANAGFLRPEAALSIVVVSDEDDAGDDLFGQYPQGVLPIPGYIAFLQALKNGTISNAPVLFSAVAPPGGFALRYEALVQAFGGILVSIEDPTWGEQLANLGEVTFALQRTFRLSNPADAGSVVVTINGTEVPATDYTVSADGELVVLNDQPPPGAIVEVDYSANCVAAPPP